MDTQSEVDPDPVGGDADIDVEVVTEDPQTADFESGTPTGKHQSESDGMTPEEALESIEDVDDLIDTYRAMPEKVEASPPPPVEKPVARKVKANTPFDHEVIRIKQDDPSLSFAEAVAKAEENLGIAKPAPEPVAQEEPVVEDDGEPRTPEEALKRAREMKKLAVEAGKELEFEKRGEYEDEEVRYLELADQLKAQAVETGKKVSAYEAAWEASVEKATGRFPEAADPKSELSAKIVEIDRRLKAEGDPIFDSPNKPFLLASMAHAEIAASRPAPRQIPAPPPQKVKPFVSASGAAHTSTPTDRRAADAEQALESLSGDEIEDLIEMMSR